MKRSTERILSTHVGSLARPEALIPILRSRSDAQSSESGSRSLTRLPGRAMVRPTGPTESPSGCGDDDDFDTETLAMVRGGGSGPVRSAHDSFLRRGGRSTQVGFSVKAGRGDALGVVCDPGLPCGSIPERSGSEVSAPSGYSRRYMMPSSSPCPATSWRLPWRNLGRRALTAWSYEFKLPEGLIFH